MAARKLDGWKKARRHHVTLPSGFEVEVEIPNLPMLVKTGQLPNELVAKALGTVQQGTLTPEQIAENAEFYAKLAVLTIKDPEITVEDVTGENPIPFEDVEMIMEIATRQRDIDAMGHHIGGLHTSKEWRHFRGFSYLDQDVAGTSELGEALAGT